MSMNDIIKENMSAIGDKDARFKALREFVQALLLKFLEEKGYFKKLAFVGGTSLRFLFGLRRYSEDLDFSLCESEGFDFEKLVESAKEHFSQLGLPVNCKAKSVRTVNSALFKFGGIMYENGLTHRKDQNLLVKLEVDSNPPAGFSTDVSFVQKPVALNILHYDRPSLFAGKLHAVLLRQYTKGRDFYDLMWFLGEKTIPNYVQLQNAMFQTTGQKLELNWTVLKELLLKRLPTVDWKKAVDDVTPFLMDGSEAQYLNPEVFGQLINGATL